MIHRIGDDKQWIVGNNPAQSAYEDRLAEEYKRTITSLAHDIDNDFQVGKFDSWSVMWLNYKTTMGTIGIQFKIPTGQVLANIIDIIESFDTE